MLTFKRILCPTDMSEPSLWAVLRAAEFARECKAELFVLHVASDTPEYSEEDVQEIAEAMNRFLPEKITIHALFRNGNAVAEILRVSASEDVDLMVIATNGTQGWQQGIIGPVADELIRFASCPVLTINGPILHGPWQRMIHEGYHSPQTPVPPHSLSQRTTFREPHKKLSKSEESQPSPEEQILALAESWR
jgi:nucleotide-binding universal stress UspA family protein